MASRDSQKQRLYDWENTISATDYPSLYNRLTFEEVESLVKTVWEYWCPGERPPMVKNMGNRNIAARGCRQYVQFPRWSWFPRVVLHECAHALEEGTNSNRQSKWQYTGKGTSPHGAEFARIFCDLLEWHCGHNLVKSAYSAKIKVAPRATSSAKPQKRRSQKVIESMRAVK